MDEDTRLNQSPHLTKYRFAWIILNYVILSVLDVNNIFYQIVVTYFRVNMRCTLCVATSQYEKFLLEF